MIVRPVCEPVCRPVCEPVTAAPISGGAPVPEPTLTEQLITAIASASVKAVYTNDPVNLRQNNDGTGPVTADSQPVRYVTDLTGAGNHLAAASSTEFATFRESGGVRWLRYDGVATSELRSITTGSAWNPLHLTGGWLAVVAEVVSSAGNGDLFSTTTGTSASAGLRTRRFATNNTSEARLGNGAATNNIQGGTNSFPDSTKRLLIAEFNGSSIRHHVNNAVSSLAITFTPGGTADRLYERWVGGGGTMRIYARAASSQPLTAELLALLKLWAQEQGGFSF